MFRRAILACIQYYLSRKVIHSYSTSATDVLDVLASTRHFLGLLDPALNKMHSRVPSRRCSGARVLEGEGDQNMLSPNMPLWHKKYFELNWERADAGKSALPSGTCLKAEYTKFPSGGCPSPVSEAEHPLSPETETVARWTYKNKPH